MKKVLIDFDQQKYNGQIQSLNSLVTDVEKIINLYASLDAEPFETKDLIPLVLDTEAFLYKSIMKGKEAKFAGIQLKKEEVFRMMEKPANYHILIETAKRFATLLDDRSKANETSIFRSKSKEQILRFLVFDDSGAFSIKPEIVDQVRPLFEVYATNPKSIFTFETAQSICSLMNEADIIKGQTDFYSLKNSLQNVVNCIDVKSGKFVINIDRVKYA